MADGQLTGAAQYAVGLGSLLFSTATAGNSIGFNVPVTPTTRTLIIQAVANNAGASFVNEVIVKGNVSGRFYYDQPPYLSGAANISTVIVPMVSLVDSTVAVTIGLGGAGGTSTVEIYGDTAAYPESVFYNGPALIYSTTTSGTVMVTGPIRVLSAGLSVEAAAAISNSINPSATFGQGALISIATAAADGVAVTTTFPEPGLIVPSGATLTYEATGAGGRGNLVAAYP
jgi:hypothetical protein